MIARSGGSSRAADHREASVMPWNDAETRIGRQRRMLGPWRPTSAAYAAAVGSRLSGTSRACGSPTNRGCAHRLVSQELSDLGAVERTGRPMRWSAKPSGFPSARRCSADAGSCRCAVPPRPARPAPRRPGRRTPRSRLHAGMCRSTPRPNSRGVVGRHPVSRAPLPRAPLRPDLGAGLRRAPVVRGEVGTRRWSHQQHSAVHGPRGTGHVRGGG